MMFGRWISAVVPKWQAPVATAMVWLPAWLEVNQLRIAAENALTMP